MGERWMGTTVGRWLIAREAEGSSEDEGVRLRSLARIVAWRWGGLFLERKLEGEENDTWAGGPSIARKEMADGRSNIVAPKKYPFFSIFSGRRLVRSKLIFSHASCLV